MGKVRIDKRYICLLNLISFAFPSFSLLYYYLSYFIYIIN